MVVSSFCWCTRYRPISFRILNCVNIEAVLPKVGCVSLKLFFGLKEKCCHATASARLKLRGRPPCLSLNRESLDSEGLRGFQASNTFDSDCNWESASFTKMHAFSHK